MRPRLSIVVAVAVFLLILVFLLAIGIGGISVLGNPNKAPVASFTYSPEIPSPDEIITFNASSSYDPDGTIVQYRWDFGDGAISTLTTPIVTHSYPLDGNYTVELTVTDNESATDVAAAVISVNCEVYFRVTVASTLIPKSDVEVTMYYYNGYSWKKAPVGSNKLEIRYDRMTQPDLANTYEEKYRNPGYTASILRYNASNIGFDIHQDTWLVYFEFKWGDIVTYWPNDTTRVYTYNNGIVEAHDYSYWYRAYWDYGAGRYVIKVKNIQKNGVSPTQCHPIIVGILCPPPPQQYYLTVRTDPVGITTIPGEGWYDKNVNVTLTAPEYVNVSSTTRYKFKYWDIDGTSKGNGVNPIIVQMNANHTATAHYIQQFTVTFAQTGLGSDATGTVVTVDGTPKTFVDLPFTKWVNKSSSVTYSYNSAVSSSVSGKAFRLDTVSGPSSPITVNGPVTVTGNYVTQYLVSFTQSGLDSSATGTIVTINGNGKTYGQLPYNLWIDCGSTVTYSYSSPVSSSVSGKRFRLNSITGPASPIMVSGPATVTGNYVTQYSITFNHTGLDSTATGTVVTVNGGPKTYVDLPYIDWVDSGMSVTYSYNNIVLSTVIDKRFNLTSVSGPTSPITVTGAATVVGNYKIQYKVIFDQTGVGSDFTGTIVTIDSVNYNFGGLPKTFWWNKDSLHSFSFGSPLVVNASKQYDWSSTSGLSTLQSGTLTVTTSGNVIGNYVVANRITFDQVGVGSDFAGTVVIIDSTSYGVSSLPVSFMWQVGSVHTFAYQSPLLVALNTKQYVWTSTSGLSTLQSGSITVSTFGSIVGSYKTQYYLSLATNPPSVTSPSGAGWYDAGTYASISTATTVDIVPGSSRYNFNGWTTGDMSEITNPSNPSTTVLMDKAKTVTANYIVQYYITFGQSGVGGDFAGTVVTVDGSGYTVGTLPAYFWWDSGSSHTFAFNSPLVVNSSKSYDWVSTTGLSTLQSGILTVTTSGSVTGNYVVHTKYQITFKQTGVGTDFTNTVVVIDGTNYDVTDLPVSFWWDSGSTHSFAYQSPLVVTANTKQYVWTSTSGLSTLQSGSIIVSTSGEIIGNYNTQYYLTLATSPPSVTSPSGAGWYDANTNATISTDAFVDIVPGSSRYRFVGWTTGDMAEIADPTKSPTTVLMDKAKTVTANYIVQYSISFDQSGVGSDFTGTVVTVDSGNYEVADLPVSFWWDSGSTHSFAYQSPLVVTANTKQYVWTSTSGLSTLQSDSITVSVAGALTGNYKTQYKLTVRTYGLGVTSTNIYNGSVILGIATDSTPYSDWFDQNAVIQLNIDSPLYGSPTRYVFTHWSGSASGSSRPVSVTINAPKDITAHYKTQHLLTVLTNPYGLSPQPTRNPVGEAGSANGWWYDASTSVTLTAQTVAGCTFSYWDVDGVSQGSGVNPIAVSVNAPHTATAYYTPISPPPTVTINPLSATIYVGQSVYFTSTVSGGTPPYTYQWYLDGNPVSGATSNSWTFTPSSSGVYYVFLKVTDSIGSIAQSESARIIVLTGPPVGGYTVSYGRANPTSLLALYVVIIALFGAALSLPKRKRK